VKEKKETKKKKKKTLIRTLKHTHPADLVSICQSKVNNLMLNKQKSQLEVRGSLKTFQAPMEVIESMKNWDGMNPSQIFADQSSYIISFINL